MRIAVLTLLASVAAAPAFAADLGTYRPGTPYHSAIVPGSDVCESQCSGDARCRGWNYVKAAPTAPGVCEFQSQVGAPVSSAISISGVNGSAGLMSSRIVSGNTNTVRVGTRVEPKPVAMETAAQRRRIVREPVPQAAPRPQMPATSAMPQYQPYPTPSSQGQAPVRFSPMLGGPSGSRSAPQGYAPAPQPTQIMQRQSRGPARQDRRAAPRQLVPTMAAAPMMDRPMSTGRPPIGQTIQPPANYIAPTPPQSAAMPRASAANPVGFDQASQSLYGSLNDDVRIPAANGAVPSDPNAPIQMSRSRPVAPVSVGPLALPQPR